MQVIDIEDVRRKIAEAAGVPVASVRADTDLRDFAVDSLALIEVAIALEEDYDVFFEQEDLGRLLTVTDVAALIRRRRACAEAC
jgi:acyl carrier protein